ncbi:hypothetical protein HII36_15545 [Nonomuraea sp. NN258]|uniref:YciI family protein n=1 Tax=Nonomuraea antri TaxID=2730852 RepID=UPI001567EB82|nr:YciI family protein [Nonomuraea antri]NRQ33249.1 hypothetical protein [Nonomuraea antri]
MKQYLLSVYQPEGELPPDQLGEVMRELDAWREEVQAAGAWVFAVGLHAPSTATVVRAGKDGDVLMTDGPFVEGKEHIGGFTIVRAADLDQALHYARGFAQATGLPIEVRPIQGDG